MQQNEDVVESGKNVEIISMFSSCCLFIILSWKYCGFIVNKNNIK